MVVITQLRRRALHDFQVLLGFVAFVQYPLIYVRYGEQQYSWIEMQLLLQAYLMVGRCEMLGR
jgi:hypothetical protein